MVRVRLEKCRVVGNRVQDIGFVIPWQLFLPMVSQAGKGRDKLKDKQGPY